MIKIFNLSDDEATLARNRKVFCLVIYDIISNKRRLKFSKILEGYGIRVQRSCFECLIEKAIFQELILDIEDFYEEGEGDNILIYRCQNDQALRYSPFIPSHHEEDQIFL